MMEYSGLEVFILLAIPVIFLLILILSFIDFITGGIYELPEAVCQVYIVDLCFALIVILQCSAVARWIIIMIGLQNEFYRLADLALNGI